MRVLREIILFVLFFFGTLLIQIVLSVFYPIIVTYPIGHDYWILALILYAAWRLKTSFVIEANRSHLRAEAFSPTPRLHRLGWLYAQWKARVYRFFEASSD